jgi:hypothetical protein
MRLQLAGEFLASASVAQKVGLEDLGGRSEAEEGVEDPINLGLKFER